MSSTFYDLYIRDVLGLTKTLVVKSHATAEAINTELQLLQPNFYIDKNDLKTWKYYQNLAGVYHTTNVPMTIISMDTLEEIPFTKENMAIHRATRKEYTHDSRYYAELIRKFPEQETLIRGILNPVPYTISTTAKDNQILWYDQSLVESNEASLIPNLQKWIDGFFVRWNVAGYGIADDLYIPSMLGIMYLQIPNVILNLRLEACKTREAHTYHIREYLASNGKLDIYLDYLTKKQALFLYRNIRYLYRNAGKRDTFKLLTSKILTDRSIPLFEYNIRHNLEELTEKIYPKVDMLIKPVNFNYGDESLESYTVAQVLTKEMFEAKNNKAVMGEAELEIEALIKDSLYTDMSTKALESIVVDLTDSAPFTLADILLNQWFYFATNDRYPSILSITNPQSGEKFPLNTKDAIIAYFYCVNKAVGITLDTIPRIEANRVRRVVLPTLNELRDIINPKYVSDELLQEVINICSPIGRYISTESFAEQCLTIHNEMLKHRDIHALQEHPAARGELEQAVARCYMDVEIDIGAGYVYDTWFNERGLDIPTMSVLDVGLLATEILKVATGANLSNNKSLKDIQENLLKLQAQLSSYTVQYLRTINSSSIKIIDWPAIRVGDDITSGHDHQDAVIANVYGQDLSIRGYEKIKLGMGDFGANENVSIIFKDFVKFDITLTETNDTTAVFNVLGKVPDIYINSSTDI